MVARQALDLKILVRVQAPQPTKKKFEICGFEKPNFNNEKISSEHEFLTPDFLQEQIRLPESNWDERFGKLIEEEIREN